MQMLHVNERRIVSNSVLSVRQTWATALSSSLAEELIVRWVGCASENSPPRTSTKNGIYLGLLRCIAKLWAARCWSSRPRCSLGLFQLTIDDSEGLWALHCDFGWQQSTRACFARLFQAEPTSSIDARRAKFAFASPPQLCFH